MDVWIIDGVKKIREFSNDVPNRHKITSSTLEPLFDVTNVRGNFAYKLHDVAVCKNLAEFDLVLTIPLIHRRITEKLSEPVFGHSC